MRSIWTGEKVFPRAALAHSRASNRKCPAVAQHSARFRIFRAVNLIGHRRAAPGKSYCGLFNIALTAPGISRLLEGLSFSCDFYVSADRVSRVLYVCVYNMCTMDIFRVQVISRAELFWGSPWLSLRKKREALCFSSSLCVYYTSPLNFIIFYLERYIVDISIKDIRIYF